MKITGIIAEYNPFHNGHLYQIKKARELTGADYIIVVMSGNLTQRGTPALIDKYSRAQMALSGGADLVIELPACYATASAEYFAMGAISILNQLGCVDSICFGSENGNIAMLTKIANALVSESEDFVQALKNNLKNGDTYPVARNAALAETISGITSYDTILGFPNNILGIEYIKALIRQNSSIKPYTNLRIGADYHSSFHTVVIFVFPFRNQSLTAEYQRALVLLQPRYVGDFYQVGLPRRGIFAFDCSGCFRRCTPDDPAGSKRNGNDCRKQCCYDFFLHFCPPQLK